MKIASRHWSLLAGAALALLVAGCHKKSSSPSGETVLPPTGVAPWAWVGGAKIAGRSGVYPPQAASLVGPGGRDGAANWIDTSGNLWLFGGVGFDVAGSTGSLNDLWEYNVSTKLWTCVSGSNTVNGTGTYNTVGTGVAQTQGAVPCSGATTTGTTPGARSGASHWTDTAGNFWLFGGVGYDSGGTQGDLNDLWEYVATSGEWVWIGGSNTANAKGVYPASSPGLALTAYLPGAREGAVTWTDAAGNFWLFGGGGYDSVGNNGLMNDIWQYSTTTHLWTYYGGAIVANSQATYGTEGTAAATNLPVALTGGAGWIDAAGTLWLFGGTGYDVNQLNGYLNDVWTFSPSTKEWTWVAGAQAANGAGVYGTLNTPSSSNLPGPRAGASVVHDTDGNVWLFGGQGYDANTNQGYLDDLWEYNITNKTWQYVSGSTVVNPYGVYGTFGVGSVDNAPGGRYGTAFWISKSNVLWVFGGGGYDANSLLGDLNDLWTTPITP